ncbi:MAG: tetratricopeptide repeat protein, partial [Deltaproteobacteria bacterium]|nr:tetratricopeptide repeat protein [Deltaproteobacteria bacterium]
MAALVAGALWAVPTAHAAPTEAKPKPAKASGEVGGKASGKAGASKPAKGKASGKASGNKKAARKTSNEASEPRGRAGKKDELLEKLTDKVGDAEQVLAAAAKAANKEKGPTEEELAKRLVRGQLKLVEGDFEGAGVAFLDILENHPNSQAAPQAVFFLGEALINLDMERWAFELFIQNLGDSRPESKRFHQRSVAHLLDLAIPRREHGFARKPGLSATPEARARLQAVGLSTTVEPPRGKLRDTDIERLARWAESFPAKSRVPELSYAYGRHLYLSGRHDQAIAVLDAMSPVDIPITRGGTGAKWRVRAAYVAASAALAADDPGAALDRFSRITKANPSAPRDREIKQLAYMAIARIHHDEGNVEDAVRSYRRIGRDSAYFPEAMYELAWTLMANKQYEQAVQALDLLLVYDPDSPIVAEIKHLRGKVRIQQRDYEGAEEQFLALRREFDRLAKRLGGKLQSKGDATAYFAAVVGEDMEHFSLDALLPTGAVNVARALPRASHAQKIAREVGMLDRELEDLRALLSRMEEAVGVPHKAKLFNDLAAHLASLDQGASDVVDVQEQLVVRLSNRAKGAGLESLEGQRRKLRSALDAPRGGASPTRDAALRKVEKLEQAAHKLELTVAGQRAQLVATERYYEETRADQKIDHQAFLTQAAQMRDEIATLETESVALRRRVARARAGLRFANPEDDSWRLALTAYQQHLSRMHVALAKVAPDAGVEALWKRTERWHAKSGAVREGLDGAAQKRLAKAIIIMKEERANLDQYRTELDTMRGGTKDL